MHPVVAVDAAQDSATALVQLRYEGRNHIVIVSLV